MSNTAKHPRRTAGTSFCKQLNGYTVAQLLLEYLELEGATKLFGIPGGALIYLIDDLKKRNDKFDFFICRQETGAAYIAHGYARVSGQLGVVLTTAGPAATNALTGTMNAQAANVSLLTITGEIPENYYGRGYLQEGIDAKLNVDTIYRNAVESSAVVSSSENFQTLFEHALRVARSQPPRAAHISLPNDVAGSCIGSEADDYAVTFPVTTGNYRTEPTSTDRTLVEAAFEELRDATRPLFFLGNGARQALSDPDRRKRFEAFTQRYAIPVMTSPDAKGIFPETHAMSLRNYGMTACAWPDKYIMGPEDADHFDALVVIGSSLGELSTSVVAKDHYSKNLIPTEHFTQVDLDQSTIGRNFPITRGIVGDASATIDALCDFGDAHTPNAGKVETRQKLLADIRETSPYANPSGVNPSDDPLADYNSTASPTHPAAMMRVINEVVQSGHIFIDAGNCVGWSLHYLVVAPPLHYHSALAMGPMGFAVGAVVGGKLAAPDQTCVAIVGDGAFMMQGSEISTAAQYGIGAIWIVLNDNDLAMVSQGMAELFPPKKDWEDYYKLGAPDLVKYSEGLGAAAVAVTPEQDPSAFRDALANAVQGARSGKPQVIVVHIDTAPMPPYGWPTVPASKCSKSS